MTPGSRKMNWTIIFLIVSVVDLVNVHGQSSCTTLRNEPGMCVPVRICKTISSLLLAAARPLPPSIVTLVRMSYCGTFNNLPHACCALSEIDRPITPSTPPPTTADPQTQRTTTRASVVDSVAVAGPEPTPTLRPSNEPSASDIEAGMSILEAMVCGKSDADRVANGVDANLSEYPWMALLVYSDTVKRSLDCGGSLITNSYVLTAAHCIRVARKKLVSVRLGEHDTRSTIDCEGFGEKRKCAPAIQEIDVEEAIYHKDYNPSRFSDDIGLIRLVSPAVFQSNVRPVCLPITTNSRNADINQMWVAGWGRIETGLKASVLQKALVPVKTNEYCQQIHRVFQFTEKHMCAGGENEIDACKGDSGGPLFYQARYRLGARYVQYGLVSAGSTVCGANFPGIYVRITSYLQWIAGNLSP